MFLSRPPDSKNQPIKAVDQHKKDLIEKLLKNEISIQELKDLRDAIKAEDLSDIIQRIYDLNEKYILELSAVEGVLRKLNEIKNSKRNARFKKKIHGGFRDLDNKNKKVILAEGDSWFNYPIILTDLIDRISMEEDFAVYSLASGGDWLLNMLTARHYVEELSVLHPDIFLISGGGNDLVGSSRLAAMLEPSGNCQAFNKCELAVQLIKNANTEVLPLNKQRFDNGVQYLSTDFFALLMFFNLQYYFLINGILKNAKQQGDKFYGIRIITQGYDYPIPSFDKHFGLNPLLWYIPIIRSFLGHGGWLKAPMQMRGINNPGTQRDIVYAMIYLFNEMMIDIGRLFNTTDCCHVSHIDSRDSVTKQGWTDELHPKPEHFMKTAKVFVDCIKCSQRPTYDHVYVVHQIYPAS